MTTNADNICVIGAGAWGTALAQVLATAGRNVTLYARAPALAAELGHVRLNQTYLPGVSLSRDIRMTADLTAAKDADIILIVTPAQHVRNVLIELRRHLSDNTLVVNCAKGMEIASGKFLSEVAAEVLPGIPYAVLSGPTFAHEVARGLPAAVTLAAALPVDKAAGYAQALSAKTFRPYLSSDPIGVEIAGALKNVMAVACGIVEGKNLGQNARAAVMTRGMAEIKRFGLKKGAQADTFLGLAGLGDLTLTCNSMASRNFSLGVALGQGRSLQDIMKERRAVSEGVHSARAVAAYAEKNGIDMPISVAVDKVLHQQASLDAIISDLLSRDLKQEGK